MSQSTTCRRLVLALPTVFLIIPVSAEDKPDAEEAESLKEDLAGSQPLTWRGLTLSQSTAKLRPVAAVPRAGRLAR
jgi:hypothetical protein